MSREHIKIQDKPYKPKFHKAAFYHNTSNSDALNTKAVNESRKIQSVPAYKVNDDEASQSNTLTPHQPLVKTYFYYEHLVKLSL